jgi:glutathione peroxidase
MTLASMFLGALVGAAHGSAPATAVAPLAEQTFTRLDGSRLPVSELQGKVLLFVNVASRCGFTPQYEGLQALHAEHREAGLVIVGVPCNQFGWQEPGDAREIQSFCRMTYGVEFPMLDKQSVNGPSRSKLYQWLVQSPAGNGEPVRWNFEKFLVGRDGEVLRRFDSATKPSDPALVGAIKKALGG